MMQAFVPNVLSIAGSDASGGAGIQADLKTFAALSAHGMSAITALTAQNTQGVQAVHTPPASFLHDQLLALQDDIEIHAIKIGMIGDVQAVEIICDFLKYCNNIPVVLDPVMVAQSGDVLVGQEVICALRDTLMPMVTIVTPNIPEAHVLTGTKTKEQLELAKVVQKQGAKAVLIKGGHATQNEVARDTLLDERGEFIYEAAWVDTKNNHGTGCTLSSAIAAYLARGQSLRESVGAAKTYVTNALKASHQLSVGKGAGPVHHFHGLWPLAKNRV